MDYLRLTRGVSCDESVQSHLGPQQSYCLAVIGCKPTLTGYVVTKHQHWGVPCLTIAWWDFHSEEKCWKTWVLSVLKKKKKVQWSQLESSWCTGFESALSGIFVIAQQLWFNWSLNWFNEVLWKSQTMTHLQINHLYDIELLLAKYITFCGKNFKWYPLKREKEKKNTKQSCPGIKRRSFGRTSLH